MSPRKNDIGKHPHAMVPTDQMVTAHQDIQAWLFGSPDASAVADSSTNGQAPRTGDDYWARALGKASAPPVAPPPAAVRRPSDTTAPRFPEAEQPAEDTAASYWDRARGVAPRRPSPPERPAAPRPAAAVLVAPEVLQHAQVTTQKKAVLSAALVAPESASVPIESLATGEPIAAVRGAHARKEDPLGAEVRGAHVKADDPIAGAAWEAELNEDDVLADAVSGAHVKADDPLAGTLRPSHAPKTADPVEPSEADLAQAAAEAVRAKTRRRRWGVVPAAGAAAALAAGLGAGSAYAFFHGSGSGTGQTKAGTPSNVVLGQATIGTVSTSGYLVPGGTGDLFVKVNNPNNLAVTITGISQTGGVTVSGGVGSCSSDPAWPGTLGTSGVSVPTNNSLNISIPNNSGSSYQADIHNAVSLTNASATGCQSATFQIPVTITVRMG